VSTVSYPTKIGIVAGFGKTVSLSCITKLQAMGFEPIILDEYPQPMVLQRLEAPVAYGRMPIGRRETWTRPRNRNNWMNKAFLVVVLIYGVTQVMASMLQLPRATGSKWPMYGDAAIAASIVVWAVFLLVTTP
jgi:hypothetical protein